MTSDNKDSFSDFLKHELATDADLAESFEADRFSISVGRVIANARKSAGLSQAKLAKRAETHQSVIGRLEQADYDGHSISMLRRIAKALGKRLEIRLVDDSDTSDERDDFDALASNEIGAEWSHQDEWNPKVEGYCDDKTIA
jgi:ribosome-binding protein aMBF1 (putative translation factor)